VACRFNGYEDVDGGRLVFSKDHPEVRGFIQLLGKRYALRWGYWCDDPEFSEFLSMIDDEETEVFIEWYRKNFAGRTFEFGEYNPAAPLAGDNEYKEGFKAFQSGFVGRIAEDGSYIEWYSDFGGCVIEGFSFREVLEERYVLKLTLDELSELELSLRERLESLKNNKDFVERRFPVTQINHLLGKVMELYD